MRIKLKTYNIYFNDNNYVVWSTNMLENLRQNKIVIEKGKKFSIHYFLIESDKKIECDINIAGIAYLYILDHVNFRKKGITKNLKNIKQIGNFYHPNINNYILAIKIVSLKQKDIEGPITKLSQVYDSDIGIGISPLNILKDLLNILSLYFKSYFKISKQLAIVDENIELFLIKKKFVKIKPSDLSNDLSRYMEIFCNLREEQFYLMQKSLSRFNRSLKIVNDDIELGLILLVSSIENLSRKYGRVEETFDDDLEFYKKLKNLFEKSKYISLLTEEDSNGLFKEVGEIYINLSHLKTSAKYRNFCFLYTSPSIINEKFEEMIRNLYKIRSLILHAGKTLSINSRNQVIIFNLHTKGGNIKRFQGKERLYAELVRIPSYNDLLKIISDIFRNFIAYLYSVRESKDDKSLYKKSDSFKRNMIVGSVNKNGYKAGNIVRIEDDFHKKIDFIELSRIKNKVHEIENLIKEGKIEESREKLNKLIDHNHFSLKYECFRFACLLKIKLLYILGDYENCLEVFKDFEINEMNQEYLMFFNYKAYCKAKLGFYKEAHLIIDKVLDLSNTDELKACFLDSKGEFYQLEGKFKKAIKAYEESLEYNHDPPYIFYEETKTKLDECLNKLSKDYKSKSSVN